MNQNTGAASPQIQQDSMQGTSGQDRLLTPVSRKKFRLLAAIGGALALAALAWIVSPALGNLFGTDMTISRQQLRFATVERGDVRHDVAVQGRIVTAYPPVNNSFSPGLHWSSWAGWTNLFCGP